MNKIIQQTKEFVKIEFATDSTGHDWHHMERVWKNAKQLAKLENVGDPFIIEMGALLHDILDVKRSNAENNKTRFNKFLTNLPISNDKKKKIIDIIQSISYNGGHEKNIELMEAKIVRDADRLDALGAIGIARTFAYGGAKGQLIYDPTILRRTEISELDYRNGVTTSINHFYEKLLKLKDLMLTESGKKLAAERHKFLVLYLEQFYKEWNGEG
ncbi:HD domain-containing protein [Bacillus kwashiorkori]|uniref:HD domain-containing protein n=1 Tax=Bacillus kwashiorkori TaxID=1522318 RepID=UPI0007825AEB